MVDADRVLEHLAANGGVVRVAANVDPQWNDATAANKHRRDLVHRLQAAADLDGAPDAVAARLDELATQGLVEVTATAGDAVVRLTDAGADRVDA